MPMRPGLPEQTLASFDLLIEGKSIRLAVKENVRGRFVRVTEASYGKMNSIIIPIAGLRDFKKLLDETVKVVEETPATEQPSAGNSNTTQ